MRDKVNYTVNMEMVWEILQKDLPILKEYLEKS